MSYYDDVSDEHFTRYQKYIGNENEIKRAYLFGPERNKRSIYGPQFNQDEISSIPTDHNVQYKGDHIEKFTRNEIENYSNVPPAYYYNNNRQAESIDKFITNQSNDNFNNLYITQNNNNKINDNLVKHYNATYKNEIKPPISDEIRFKDPDFSVMSAKDKKDYYIYLNKKNKKSDELREHYSNLLTNIPNLLDLYYKSYTIETKDLVRVVGYSSVENKCDLNETNYAGKTILMMACERSDNETIEALLSNKNLDVNIVDNSGRSALSYVIYRDCKKFARLMRNRGASIGDYTNFTCRPNCYCK